MSDTSTPRVTWQNWSGILLDIEMETGDVDDELAIELAQFIVDHRLEIQLQGCWGRWCARLIELGLVTPRGAER
jgi:hypothetical protein